MDLLRMGLPLLQLLQVSLIDPLEAELPIHALHASPSAIGILTLSLLIAVGLIHSGVVPAEALQG